ncbi:MAG TPA: hypothetical protein VGL15_07590 [Vicinamibacteria bacterium]|jgi:hypothetical protein
MAPRALAAIGLVAALALGGWLLCVAAGSERPPLLSRHAEPARVVPAQTVAVTGAGKIFHDPACRFIHGPPTREPAADAVKGGYTPCVRCLKNLTGG